MGEQPKGSAVRYKRSSSAGEYAGFWDAKLWPCQKPPWGLLHAIDVNTGDIVWGVPLGITEELEAKGIHNTGAPNIGGAIATAGGLVFIAATNDSRFRAFDSSTGKEVWTVKIDSSVHATPITYMGGNGTQYVLFHAGAGCYL